MIIQKQRISFRIHQIIWAFEMLLLYEWKFKSYVCDQHKQVSNANHCFCCHMLHCIRFILSKKMFMMLFGAAGSVILFYLTFQTRTSREIEEFFSYFVLAILIQYLAVSSVRRREQNFTALILYSKGKKCLNLIYLNF